MTHTPYSDVQEPANAFASMRSPVFTVDTALSPFTAHRPVSLRNIQVTDSFWRPRRAANRDTTLNIQYQRCIESGALNNFRRAAGDRSVPFEGMYYADSDVYKWIEAASWALVDESDPELSVRLNETITLIAAAQEADGYLNTYFTGARARERWTNLVDLHELYCGGHLLQAAVAHRRVTGSTNLLQVATRWADCVEKRFGPSRRHGTDGHPELELALIELYRETRDDRYLHLARFFLDERGQQPPVAGGDQYHLDHAPITAQTEAVGHAVRALYLYAGCADLVLETGDTQYLAALHALWDDLENTKTYLTGGVGSRWEGEAIGLAYELPNDRAYAETCAGVARMMLAWRLLLLTGDGRYRDALEWTLYNAVLPGVNLAGDRFFYQNPLSDRGAHRRQQWFHTACCPPNLARTLAALPGYLWTSTFDSEDGATELWLHLPIGHVATLPTGDHDAIVEVSSGLPYETSYQVHFVTTPVKEMTLYLPAPAWMRDARVRVNGNTMSTPSTNGYYSIIRQWQAGDTVTISSVTKTTLVQAHNHVLADTGRVAITRGPLVYCLEQADNLADVDDILLDASLAWTTTALNIDGHEVVALRGRSQARTASPSTPLYARATGAAAPTQDVPVTAIPYFSWANRGAGPMQTWPLRADLGTLSDPQ